MNATYKTEPFCFHNVDHDPAFSTTSMSWLGMKVHGWTDRVAIYRGSKFYAVVLKMRDASYTIVFADNSRLHFPGRAACTSFLRDNYEIG